MRKTKKVLTETKFKTTQSSGILNLDSSSRAVLIGRKPGSGLACGFIGKAAEISSGQNILDRGVWMDLSFPHVIGVFGARGTGKSFTLGALTECLAGLPEVVADMSAVAVVVLDVQNQFWTLSISPQKDLSEDAPHLMDLNKWGLSPAIVKDVALWAPCRQDTLFPDARVFKISPRHLRLDDWLAVLEQDRYSPMGQALIELLSRSNDQTPDKLAKNARSNVLPSFQAGTVDGLRWRLEAVAEMGLIGEPGANIEILLKSGRVSVMLLRRLPEKMRALVAGALARLLASRMSDYHQSRKIARRRGGDSAASEGMPDRLWLAVDEAHVIVPADATTPASEPLVDYVKRGRDSGLSLIFATQQPSAVDSKLMSQADITFTHGLGFDADIQAAIKRMPTDSSHTYERDGRKIPTLGGVIRALAPGESIVADAASGRSFIQKTRPRLTAHGGDTPSQEHSPC